MLCRAGVSLCVNAIYMFNEGWGNRCGHQVWVTKHVEIWSPQTCFFFLVKVVDMVSWSHSASKKDYYEVFLVSTYAVGG